MVNTHESTLMDLLYRGHIKTYYLLSNVEHVDDQKKQRREQQQQRYCVYSGKIQWSECSAIDHIECEWFRVWNVQCLIVSVSFYIVKRRNKWEIKGCVRFSLRVSGVSVSAFQLNNDTSFEVWKSVIFHGGNSLQLFRIQYSFQWILSFSSNL